jgi:hypothetical protein
MIEHAGGLKQFHFNGKVLADLEVDANKHTIRALLGTGDHLHMMDNTPGGYTHFAHKDGLQTWVEHGGRVVVQLPDKTVREVRIPSNLAYIRMLEKTDGGKQFRFLDEKGSPVAQKVELPPTPELQQAKAPDEVRNWHDLRNYISSRQAAQQTLHQQDLSAQGGGGGVYRVDPSPGGVFHNHDSHRTPDQFARMMRVQPSIERTMAHELVGVPYNIMRGDDLSSPASMGLAMQDHGWLVTSYLDRLDHQDDVYGHHDWF